MIIDRNPIFATVLGSTGGAVSWVISHTPEITGVAGMVGALCTALIAVFSLVGLVINRARAFRAWLRTFLRNRQQRRFFDSEPPDDDLFV